MTCKTSRTNRVGEELLVYIRASSDTIVRISRKLGKVENAEGRRVSQAIGWKMASLL